MAGLEYLEPQQLANMLRGPEANQVLVVDVRDDDFVGGHIKGAVNIDSGQFYDAPGVDSVIHEHLQGKPVSKVVFHCMFSQQRGPRCARALLSRVQSRGAPQPAPTVYVLRGGFTHFARMYRGEQDLVEDLDPEVWDEGGEA